MRTRTSLTLCLLSVLLAGCTYSRSVQRKSNLMAYLYPGGQMTPRQASGDVRLQLPLRIGVAFVPANQGQANSRMLYRPMMPPDAEKRLIGIVRKSFAGRDWISDIVTIPSNYLVPGGGFANLQQVAQLMNVDVIALVSVDQLQTSDPRALSFLYVSVLGAYMLPLDRNETRTLIDMAVFHVPSRTFLLRAPGSSTITGNATAVGVDAQLRDKSLTGFERAMADLSKNLDGEVETFKTSVASGERKDVDVYTARGQSVRGGGATAPLEAILAVLLTAAALIVRRR